MALVNLQHALCLRFIAAALSRTVPKFFLVGAGELLSDLLAVNGSTEGSPSDLSLVVTDQAGSDSAAKGLLVGLGKLSGYLLAASDVGKEGGGLGSSEEFGDGCAVLRVPAAQVEAMARECECQLTCNETQGDWACLPIALILLFNLSRASLQAFGARRYAWRSTLQIVGGLSKHLEVTGHLILLIALLVLAMGTLARRVRAAWEARAAPTEAWPWGGAEAIITPLCGRQSRWLADFRAALFVELSIYACVLSLVTSDLAAFVVRLGTRRMLTLRD